MAGKGNWIPRVILAVCFAGLAFYGYVLVTRFQGNPTADIAAIHRLGIPVTHDEFHAMAPQSGEDAAKDYDRYLSLLRRLPEQDEMAYENLCRSNPHGDPASWSEEVVHLKTAISALEAGAARPRWIRTASLDRRRHDLRFVYTDGLPMLCHVAACYAATGQLDLAQQTLRSATRLSTQGIHDPGGFGYVSSHALLDGYAAVIKAAKNDGSTLKDLRAQIASMPQRDDHFLLDLFFLADIDELEDQPQPKSESPISNAEYRMFGTAHVRHGASADISLWRKVFESLAKNPDQWNDPQPMMLDVYRQHAKDPIFREMGSKMKECADTLTFSKSQIARQRVLLSAIDLLIYRKEHAAFPESLPDWGEQTTDLFTGGRLTYRSTKDGFLLYSLGPNMKDDGGRDWAPAIGTAYDIAFKV